MTDRYDAAARHLCARVHPLMTVASPEYSAALEQIKTWLRTADEYERMKGGVHHPPSADDPLGVDMHAPADDPLG